MKTRILYLALLSLFILGSAGPVCSQKKQPTIEEINKNISKLEEDIKRNEALRDKVKNNQKATQSELKLVRQRIDNRQKLVASLNSQMTLLDREISSKSKDIRELDENIVRLKKEYGDMIYAAYKNHLLNNSVAFIFASQDFNEATKRIDYMRRYNNLRQQTVVRIDSVSRNLHRQVEELALHRQELTRTRSARDRELKSLRNDEAVYAGTSKKLSDQEKKIASTIRQKEREKKNAEAQLQKIISEEAKKSASKKLSTEDARRMAELSGQFDQNRGKFPYPVQGGVIIDRYGKHPHPTQKGLTIDNKGVNIMSEKGAPVRNLFNGTVTRVVYIKGLNNCVMVQHGDYFTVYSNLATVAVKVNDRVATNQQIGALPATDDNNDYYLHFEIWKGTKNLNPELWFYR